MVMKTKLFFTGLALMASITLISAQGNGCRNGSGNGSGNGNCNGTGKGTSYVDANKDGKCDNLGTKTAQAGTKKGQHQGNATAAKKGTSQGKHLQNGTGPNATGANGTCVNAVTVVK